MIIPKEKRLNLQRICDSGQIKKNIDNDKYDTKAFLHGHSVFLNPLIILNL